VLTVLRMLAFTGCALLGLLPSVEVDCRLDVPLAWVSPPPPASTPADDPRLEDDGPCLDDGRSEAR
jgi:hypothetical protein